MTTTTTKAIKVSTLTPGSRFSLYKYPQTGTVIKADSMYCTVKFDGRSSAEEVAPSMEVEAIASDGPAYQALVDGIAADKAAAYKIEFDGYSARQELAAKVETAKVEKTAKQAAAAKAWETIRAKKAAAKAAAAGKVAA